MSDETTPAPEEASDSPSSDAVLAADATQETAADSENHVESGKARQKAGSKSKRKPTIASIEDLVTFTYESNARILDVSRDVLKKVPVTDEGISVQGELVVALSANDPTLTGAYKLLQFAARQGVPLRRADGGALAQVLNRVVDLAILALGSHPVFRVWADQLVDPRKEPYLTSEHLRSEASRLAPEKLGLTSDQFKSADSERLVRNATACYGLLRVLQREWTLDQTIDAFYGSFWRHEMLTAIGPERAASELAAVRDPGVLGLVGANYLARISRLDGQIATQDRAAAASLRREQALRTDLSDAIERHQAALKQIDELSAEVMQLRKSLAAERDNRVVDKSHMADDYETLRTRIIRRLGGEIDLLTDGLHALRNGAPSVAEEFLDRSLLALTREVAQLKEASGGME